MNKSRIDIITKLVKSINLSNINYPLITSNSNKLYKIHSNLKPFWNEKKQSHQQLDKDNDIYKKIDTKYKLTEFNNLLNSKIIKDFDKLFLDYIAKLKDVESIKKRQAWRTTC